LASGKSRAGLTQACLPQHLAPLSCARSSLFGDNSSMLVHCLSLGLAVDLLTTDPASVYYMG
jgi:hypothetical protein